MCTALFVFNFKVKQIPFSPISVSGASILESTPSPPVLGPPMAMPTRLCCAVLVLLHRWAIGHELKSATVRREAGVLGEGGEQSFLFCTVLHFADTMTQAGMKQEETTLQEGWTISWRTFVGAAGDLRVVDLLYEEEVINQIN